MFSLMYLCYTQQEIAWAHLIFAARVLQCTPALFDETGMPLWAADRISLDRDRIERAPRNACDAVHLQDKHTDAYFARCERLSRLLVAPCAWAMLGLLLQSTASPRPLPGLRQASALRIPAADSSSAALCTVLSCAPLAGNDGAALCAGLVGDIASAFEQPSSAPALPAGGSPTKLSAQTQQRPAGPTLEHLAAPAASAPADLGGAGMLDALAALATPAAATVAAADAPPPSA